MFNLATPLQLVASFIFLIERFYYYKVLPLIGILWHIEAIARGVRTSNGSFFGRPILYVHPYSKVIIGRSFNFISASRRCSSGSLYSPVRIATRSRTSSIVIGDNVGLNGTSIVSRSKSIRLGNNTIVAPNCVIMDSPYHVVWPRYDRINYNSDINDKDVFIGDDCWIGTGSIILPGSFIGDGSVVAARTVVRGTYPPNSLIAGVPSRLIKDLSNAEA